MKLLRKVLAVAGIGISLITIGTAIAVPQMNIRAREIGRTDPKRAANYRLPWRNFFETYRDGEVLGVTIGMPKAAAIQNVLKTGLTVTPEGWGDMRAGGAALYEPSALLRMMMQQRRLGFYDASDTRLGMEMTFRGDRVASVSVSYVNTEFP